MDLGNMFVGDWGKSMMQGFQMAHMQDQMELARQKMQQDYERNRLNDEETRLRIRAQTELLNNSVKQQKQMGFDVAPTETTRQIPTGFTGTEEYGVPTGERTETTFGPSKIMQRYSPIFGEGPATILEDAARRQDVGGFNTLVNTFAGKEQGNRTLENILAENVRSGKMTMQEAIEAKTKEKTPNEIELQIRANAGDADARAILDRIQRDKETVALRSRPPAPDKTGTWQYIGTDEQGNPLQQNTLTGEIKVGSVPGGGKIKSKPSGKQGGFAGLAEALGGGNPANPSRKLIPDGKGGYVYK